jgi:ParB family chromosome partitioning protein
MSEEIVNLKLSDLVESPTNPRRYRDKAKDTELLDSVMTAGVLQPLIVRVLANPKAGFEIVAGSRRYRAAKAAGLKTVPCIVRDLSDDGARQLQQIENLQRDDVHPLDEAAGYAELAKYYGGDIVKISIRVGKSESYIRQRMKLCELSKAGRDALTSGKVTITGAEKLARLPDKQQTEVLKRYTYNKVVSAADLDRQIKAEFFLDLHGAAWKKDDAQLVPTAGACTTCPKRTGFLPSLFPDVAKKDTCTDSVCFAAKGAAYVAQDIERANAEGKPLQPISDDYGYNRRPPEITSALDCGKYSLITEGNGQCEHVTRGIYVDGRQLGQVVKICTEKKCDRHSKAVQYAGTDDWKKKRAAEREKSRINAAAGVAILDAIVAKASAAVRKVDSDAGRLREIAKHILHRMEHNDRMKFCKRKGVEPALCKNSYGTTKDYEAPLLVYIEKLPAAELVPLMVEMSLWGRANIVVGSSYHGDLQASFFSYAKSEGVDAAKIEREIRAQFAEKKKAKNAKAKTGKGVKPVASKKPAKKKPASKKKSASSVKAAEAKSAA